MQRENAEVEEDGSDVEDDDSVDPTGSSKSFSSTEDSYVKLSEHDAMKGKSREVKANDEYFINRPILLDEIRDLKNKDENHS